MLIWRQHQVTHQDPGLDRWLDLDDVVGIAVVVHTQRTEMDRIVALVGKASEADQWDCVRYAGYRPFIHIGEQEWTFGLGLMASVFDSCVRWRVNRR